MAKQGKVWGMTEEILNNGSISVNVLQIKRDGFCSEHQHSQKINMFHVISGRLEISQWNGCSEGEMADVTVLESGQSTIVPMGVWHMFRAIEDTLCIECYAVKFSGEDIIRRTRGGIA